MAVDGSVVFLSAESWAIRRDPVRWGDGRIFMIPKKSDRGRSHARWQELNCDWKAKFKGAEEGKDGNAVLKLVAELYECEANLLENYVARDWDAFCSKRPKSRISDGPPFLV